MITNLRPYHEYESQSCLGLGRFRIIGNSCLIVDSCESGRYWSGIDITNTNSFRLQSRASSSATSQRAKGSFRQIWEPRKSYGMVTSYFVCSTCQRHRGP